MTQQSKGIEAAHQAYAKTTGGLLSGHPMENAITAYLEATKPEGEAGELVERLKARKGEAITRTERLMDEAASLITSLLAETERLTRERDAALVPETIDDKIEAMTNVSLISTFGDGMNDHRLAPTLENAVKLLRWANGHIFRLSWGYAQESVAREAAERQLATARADALDFETFVRWLRPWIKSRFGVWITHNTAKGAHSDLIRSLNNEPQEGKI